MHPGYGNEKKGLGKQTRQTTVAITPYRPISTLFAISVNDQNQT